MSESASDYSEPWNAPERGRLGRLLGCWLKTFLVIAVPVALVGVWLYARAGQFRAVEELDAGECRRYSGAPGAEDLEVDRATGLLLISSDDRRRRMAGEQASGDLFTLDLRDPAASIQALPHDFEEPLLPHGIHLLEAGNHGVLHVVNHGGEGDRIHSVEVFRYAAGAATHLRTVRDPLLNSPNDVVGVDERRFYATNDHGPGGALRQQLDDYIGAKRSNVVYWDGEQMRVVAEGIGFANGIALNPEQEYLYVGATTEGKIHVYARDEETGDLSLIKSLYIDTGVDNLEVDLYGGIWTTGHPHLLSFVRHAASGRPSPSQVFWVDPAEDMEPPIRPVWIDAGEELSGASVAVPFGARFAVGSVFEEHLLVCERS